ncbi:hypothetical protein DL96DRAFT_1490084 [Flagelloscypha sp. PMI_526]|nr:hypothetical protein DL96DRAFT_1490084 [Flagelloscypha sp. PMI_526]
MAAFHLPDAYPLVVANLAFTAVILQGLGTHVTARRRAAKIEYPQMYASIEEMKTSPAALKFNGAQRAHQNTLENVPVMLIMSMIVGTKFPYLASGLGFVWNASRILYMYGYLQGPSKRNSYGAIVGTTALWILIYTGIYTGVKMVYSVLMS